MDMKCEMFLNKHKTKFLLDEIMKKQIYYYNKFYLARVSTYQYGLV